MDRSVRAARLADQIRDYLALWTHRDLEGQFFSITQVTVSPDLTQATAWVEAALPGEGEALLVRLRERLPRYQRQLHRALGRRSVPQLRLALDGSQELGERFDRLLNLP